MSDQSGDQTEAELEKTRRVVAESMQEQIATNDAAANPTPADETVEVSEAPKGNAGRDEWAAYAEAQGYDVTDMGRDEIRDMFAEET